MTKYSEMAANLRSQIESDRYKPGDKLPTTSELCAQFGVSKITVRRAMDELERDGLISRRRGSGTFVTGPQPSAQTSSFISSCPSPFPADVLEPNELNYTTVHEFSVTYPSARQAKNLHIDSDLFVYSLCRTHTKNSEVQVVEYTAIPMNLCDSLRESDAERSLMRKLAESDGLRIASVHQVIEAVHPPEQSAQLLCITQKASVLRVRQVAYLEGGRPCASFVTYHAPDYVFYNISSK